MRGKRWETQRHVTPDRAKMCRECMRSISSSRCIRRGDATQKGARAPPMKASPGAEVPVASAICPMMFEAQECAPGWRSR